MSRFQLPQKAEDRLVANKVSSQERRRWQKLQQIYVPSTDGSAVRTYLVTGSGYAAGSQRAYSLGSCATGQPDGRIVVALNAPLPQGGGIVTCHISSLSIGNSAHYNVVHSCITVQ